MNNEEFLTILRFFLSFKIDFSSCENKTKTKKKIITIKTTPKKRKSSVASDQSKNDDNNDNRIGKSYQKIVSKEEVQSNQPFMTSDDAAIEVQCRDISNTIDCLEHENILCTNRKIEIINRII